MNNFKGEPEVKWSSFMPALGYALGASKGDVLELGIGHFSTPFLHSFCEASGRNLISVEESAIWGEMFLDLCSPTHRIEICPYSEFLWDFRPLPRLGVVFIDSSPGGKPRADLFYHFLDLSEFVVVHDYHRENREAIEPLLDETWTRVFDSYDPPTLLASKFHETGHQFGFVQRPATQ